MDKAFADTLTDEVLNAATGADLRKLATDAGLSHYDTHVSVLSVNLRSELLSSPAAMAEVGKALEVVSKAYAQAGQDPKIETGYGSSAEVRVWQDDSGLRSSLRYARDRVLKDN